MKVGDMIQWRDQTNYPGLCGIVTERRKDSSTAAPTHNPREIFVHWTNVPKDCASHIAIAGWEKEKDLELLSTGETE
jgi:hypothetical protein